MAQPRVQADPGVLIENASYRLRQSCSN